MKPHTAVTIRFLVKEGLNDQFKKELTELFEIIAKEPDFGNALLHQDAHKPNEVFVYEVWKGTPEEFLESQMKKPYRHIIKHITDTFLVEKEFNLHTAFAEWGSNLTKF